MTIKEALTKAIEILKQEKVDSPLLDSQLILGHILNVDKLYIITNYDRILEQNVIEEFFDKIILRKKGSPVQYITGKQEFMSIMFEVNQDVLIPRPDTEILVESVIKYCKPNEHYEVLDLCTGSGCIAVSLAKYLENVIITAVDISNKAIETAKRNAQANMVYEKVNFFVGDLFEPLNDLSSKFDVIVSNPPYICTDEIEKLDTNVKDYEPKLALDGGYDGLYFYKKIINNSKKFLQQNGAIFFEIGYNQSELVKSILEKDYFDDINIRKDLAGRDRVIYGKFVK